MSLERLDLTWRWQGDAEMVEDGDNCLVLGVHVGLELLIDVQQGFSVVECRLSPPVGSGPITFWPTMMIGRSTS